LTKRSPDRSWSWERWSRSDHVRQCLNDIAALVLLSGADFLSVFAKPQLDAMAYLFLRLHSHGITVASIFWGLWLFPFGMLVIRSGFIPRVFGYLCGSGRLPDELLHHPDPAAVRRAGFEDHDAHGDGGSAIIFWLAIWRERPVRGPRRRNA
jgi:hypothetical protein